MKIEDVRIGMGVKITSMGTEERGRVVEIEDGHTVWVEVPTTGGYDRLDVDPSEIELED